MKRLLILLGLGICTTIAILVFSFTPSSSQAKLIPVDRSFPTFPLFPVNRANILLSIDSIDHHLVNPTLDLVQQGKTYYQKGQLESAVAVWQQAISAFVAAGDRLHQAMTLNYLAQGYQQLGIWEKANSAIAESLALLKQSDSIKTKEWLHILAETLTTQGSLQFEQGQVSSSVTSWQKAENIFGQAGDSVGTIRSQINQSQALIALGFYKRANDMLGLLYNKLPAEEPIQLAILLNYGETLGLVGLLVHEPPKSQTDEKIDEKQTIDSVTVLQKGLVLAKKIHSPGDIISAELSLGNTYRSLYQNELKKTDDDGYYQKAWDFYQQAREQSNSPTDKIQALLNQQSLMLAKKSHLSTLDLSTLDALQVKSQADSVEEIAFQIQPELERLPINRTTLYAQIQLADNLLRIGNSSLAAKFLETAVTQAERLGDLTAQSYALGYLGQAYEQQQITDQKSTNQPLLLTNKALDIAMGLNAPDISYRWLWQLARLEREHNPEKALKNYWAAYQTLQSFRTNLAADNPNLRFSFQKQQIEPVYREFVDLLLQRQTVSDRVNNTFEHHQYEKIQDNVESALEYPLYTARRVMQDLQSAELSNFLQEPCTSQNIRAIDQQVNKSGSSTVSLYTIILGDRIEVIAKFPGQSLFHYFSTIPESEVRQKIGDFQQIITQNYNISNKIKSQGMEIYQWLIKPIEEKLESSQIKTIVFTLDGPLRNIPMAALYDGNKYLIEKYAVAVTLDLGIQDPKPLRNDHLSVLAAALTNPPAQLSRQFSKLSFTSKEIDAIKSTRGIKTKTLEDEKFTLEALRKELSDFSYTVVHLATHGKFSSNPEDTFILAASSHLPNHKMSDGKVRLRDIDKMFRTITLNRTNTLELLVLSACQTALGDEQASLGIAGVAVRSGTSSVIASLWSIDDKSTQKLMAVFYNKIAQPGVSRAEALRQAQLALLQAKKDNTYRHPYYWGAFLLLGNWL